MPRSRNFPPANTLMGMAAKGPLCSEVKVGLLMTASDRGVVTVILAGVVSVGLLCTALTGTASAENLFERFFGGFRRALERPTHVPRPFDDPLSSLARALNPLPPPPQRIEDIGPARGFCVRTCDGHFFPVQASGGVSAAAMCHAFCPASETQVYTGSVIDFAVASDGSRYVDLAKAFLYRKQTVAGCTCNGRNQFGLARINISRDPTLRPGDLLVTRSGVMTYTGTSAKTAEFTPAASYAGFSKAYQRQLSAIRVMPPTPGEQPVTAPLQSPRATTAQSDGRIDHFSR